MSQQINLANPQLLKKRYALGLREMLMALGVVLCDRYGLNTGIYAAAVTATTLLSLITLPMWHGWMT